MDDATYHTHDVYANGTADTLCEDCATRTATVGCTMISVDIFWGNQPDHQSEREFLAQLRADLEDRQLDALVLANFYILAAACRWTSLLLPPTTYAISS